MPRYMGIGVLLLASLLVLRLIWQGSRYVLRSEGAQPQPAPHLISAGSTAAPPWQTDVLTSLGIAANDAAAGKLMAAEVDVDRAGSILTAMRLESHDASQPFFEVTLAALDHVLAGHADDERLADHVTQARIALAELRSAMKGEGNSAPDPPPAAQRATIGAPRTLAADSVLSPATLRASYLDATLMPETSEILLPPESREFTDGVRVENITIAGAAQTLDGVRWRNVTFVGTHLRYEDGGLDLENVRFVNCRFGFPSDSRGARLANAIALGQTSLTLDAASAPADPAE